MTDKPFLDTNVVVYAFDSGAGVKQSRAIEILEGKLFDELPTISTQVLQEFYVTVVQKLAIPLGEDDALKAVSLLTRYPLVQINAEHILSAIRTRQTRQLSFWDALIIEAARVSGCSILLTEDMQHGFEINGVRIVNPFLD